MSILMERYMKRAGISTPMGRVLEEAKYDAYKDWHQLPFLHVVDHHERGDYRAHIEDIDGEEVMSYGSNDDEDGEVDMVTDGFMRNIQDMRGLLHHLQQVHMLPHNAVIYDKHSDFERAVNKYKPDDEDESVESTSLSIYGVSLKG